LEQLRNPYNLVKLSSNSSGKYTETPVARS